MERQPSCGSNIFLPIYRDAQSHEPFNASGARGGATSLLAEGEVFESLR
jgi:hypothetical protein